MANDYFIKTRKSSELDYTLWKLSIFLSLNETTTENKKKKKKSGKSLV